MAHQVSDAARGELLKVADEALAPQKGELHAVADIAHFCAIFNSAKPTLQALIPVVSLIPGIGKAAAAALTALLAVGSALCPTA